MSVLENWKWVLIYARKSEINSDMEMYLHASRD